MHQRGGYIEIKEQQEIARLPTDSRANYVLQDLFLPHLWQLQSHNGHFNLIECSLNHKNNFTRGFSIATTATFAAITYSPLVRHKLPPLQKHLAGVFPNKHPVRCYFHFISPAGMMDLPFPEDFTRWIGLLAQCSERSTNRPPGTLTCGNTRRFPTLAPIISFLDVRSQKSEVFQQLKVLGP